MKIPPSVIEDAKAIANLQDYQVREFRHYQYGPDVRIARFILQEAEKPDEEEGLKAKLEATEKALHAADAMAKAVDAWSLIPCKWPDEKTTEANLALVRAFDAYAALRSPASPAEPAKPAQDKKEPHLEPWEEWCDACDGCGWTEGGKTLETKCGQCGGVGKIGVGVPAGGEEAQPQAQMETAYVRSELLPDLWAVWNMVDGYWAAKHDKQATAFTSEAGAKAFVADLLYPSRYRVVKLWPTEAVVPERCEEEPQPTAPKFSLEDFNDFEEVRLKSGRRAYCVCFRDSYVFGEDAVTKTPIIWFKSDGRAYSPMSDEWAAVAAWEPSSPTAPVPVEQTKPDFQVGQRVSVKDEGKYHFSGRKGTIHADEGMLTYRVEIDGATWIPLYPAEALEPLPDAPNPVEPKCPACGGSGMQATWPCQRCGGSGYLKPLPEQANSPEIPDSSAEQAKEEPKPVISPKQLWGRWDASKQRWYGSGGGTEGYFWSSEEDAQSGNDAKYIVKPIGPRSEPSPAQPVEPETEPSEFAPDTDPICDYDKPWKVRIAELEEDKARILKTLSFVTKELEIQQRENTKLEAELLSKRAEKAEPSPKLTEEERKTLETAAKDPYWDNGTSAIAILCRIALAEQKGA